MATSDHTCADHELDETEVVITSRVPAPHVRSRLVEILLAMLDTPLSSDEGGD